MRIVRRWQGAKENEPAIISPARRNSMVFLSKNNHDREDFLDADFRGKEKRKRESQSVTLGTFASLSVNSAKSLATL
jgi:hypothetical protein